MDLVYGEAVARCAKSLTRSKKWHVMALWQYTRFTHDIRFIFGPPPPSQQSTRPSDSSNRVLYLDSRLEAP
ncbi:hypothetical protein E4U42_006292 [Claviceps africana]|uniref:Uncharacterized protein n=1 Tax=Claviceps africana TaxID=83212 RepID=A0A8K0JH81_9HYPO|nr:hypothetical protein E4U42_006292 [Claviceps africana]